MESEAPSDEYNCPADTPSRSQHPASSEDAFIKSVQRNFAKNYAIPETQKDTKADFFDLQNLKDKDRDVYAGFKENESDASSVCDENNGYKDKLVKSIERRVGGYEPVFCKLDTNQEEITFKTPQVRFRNFVDPGVQPKKNNEC
jgi:hypothetical protein